MHFVFLVWLHVNVLRVRSKIERMEFRNFHLNFKCIFRGKQSPCQRWTWSWTHDLAARNRLVYPTTTFETMLHENTPCSCRARQTHTGQSQGPGDMLQGRSAAHHRLSTCPRPWAVQSTGQGRRDVNVQIMRAGLVPVLNSPYLTWPFSVLLPPPRSSWIQRDGWNTMENMTWTRKSWMQVEFLRKILELVYKLKHLGVRGHVLAWIESFLRGRRQRVVLRNGFSTWKEVTSGVPQGSILGPLLFLFYVNDIPDIVSSTAKMFADDTKVYRKISSKADCDSLQSDLNELAAWSKRWLLEFNAEKCVVLRIRAALWITNIH